MSPIVRIAYLPKVEYNKYNSYEQSGRGGGDRRNGDGEEHDLTRVMNELNSLVGLKEVKEMISEIQAYISIQQQRSRFGLKSEPLTLHMIFKGNPGTGKTTISRLLGKIFLGLGVLSRGHVVEVERADLVGEYIGHTAQKTREKLKKALGGILFVDEAYSLGRGGEKDFGKEAIDVLVKGMEDFRNEVVLILAGYRWEMERFMELNPGLRSRFPVQIDFPDYSVGELLQISDLMAAERHYRLTPDAKEFLKNYLGKELRTGSYNIGNARLVRNLLEKGIRRQALRLCKQNNLTREELISITPVDLDPAG